MTIHPLQRFLGVDASADARALLDLRSESLTLPQVDAALRRQLARVHKHPDGSGPDGELVKKLLRDAAQQVKLEMIRARRGPEQHTSPVSASPPRPTSTRSIVPPAPTPGRAQPGPKRPAVTIQLTEFDRAVLAVLVGCGGWNAECRTRLVALASAYGVSVQGLMRVIIGLSDYARRGGARLGVAEIAGGRAHMTAPSSVVPDSMDETSDLLARLLPEIREDSIWSRLKLIALFSVITIIALALLLRVLLAESAATRSPVVLNTPEQVEPSVDPGDTDPIDSIPPHMAGQVDGPASFVEQPTFLGSSPTQVMVDAADALPRLPAQFDEVARKLTVDPTPSDAVRRNWKVSVATAAEGWSLADAHSRKSIQQGIFDVLYAASASPETSDEFVGELMPPTQRLAEPVDVIRGTWRAGMLGQIAGANLPPIVTQHARELLDTAIGTTSGRHDTAFDDAAGAWLTQTLPELVERAGYDDRAFDYWELWLSSARAVSNADQSFEDLCLRAMVAVLSGSSDLTVDNPPARIVGRLVSQLDLESSAATRTTLLSLFENDTIASQNLWILTSMILAYEPLAWTGRDLVVPPSADVFHRRRLAARWQQRWPPAAVHEPGHTPPGAARLAVDSELFERWQQLLDDLHAPLAEPSSLEQLNRIIAVSRLNAAAAALYGQDTARAEQLLDSITDVVVQQRSADGNTAPSSRPPMFSPRRVPGNVASPRGGGAASTPRPGQALGIDGEWAALFEQASRNTTDKLNLLGALRSNAGTDLGPIDAEAFVHAVYRGTPQDVRAMAQQVLLDQFAAGPNVAMAMLDQSPDAPLSRELGDTIAAMTGHLLPPVRAPSFWRQMRLALVEHAIALQPPASQSIAVAERVLAESYRNRRLALTEVEESSIDPNDAVAASTQLIDAWRRAASRLVSTAPTPDDLAGIAHRHETRRGLARGPVQAFVANQVAVLELLAYVTTADRPARRSAVLQILSDSSSARTLAATVLEQSAQAELAMAEVWRLRMGAPPRDTAEAGGES